MSSEYEKAHANLAIAKQAGIDHATERAAERASDFDPGLARAVELGTLKGIYPGHILRLETEIANLKRQLNWAKGEVVSFAS
jgi:hypothetical protein